MTALDQLRAINPDEFLTADTVFNAIFEAGSALGERDRESDQGLEIAIRLLEANRTGQLPQSCVSAVEMLVEECGLYPYVDINNFSFLTQSVIEAHAFTLDVKIYLHAKQMQILLWLLSGDNVILSAPTSFGKSLLIDALLSRTFPRTVVMILPTIALIDETRRRLTKRFGERYIITTTITDHYDAAVPTIFILTQERFLQRIDIKKIDLFFVDEFYKLDPSRKDERYETLNLAVYKGLPRSKQCFMAGPHISSIELGEHWRGNFRFIQTDYRTVSVNVIDRSSNKDKMKSFLNDIRSVGHESSIVFTKSPASANELMNVLVEAEVGYPTDLGDSVSQWIASNYHPEWSVAKGTATGIAVHHGRLPRALGQLFVQLFDSGSLKVLICTSTLIEGVNTSAANVFIYDKKINRTDFDFFSFANIRGRVGRMMRHFVGRAFLYHEAPTEIETRVDVPILSNPSESTDYIMMNVDPEGLSRSGKARQTALPLSSGLSSEILREHSGLGVELLVEVSNRLKSMTDSERHLLSWTGFPQGDQRVTLAELVMIFVRSRHDQTGLFTHRQIAWAWSQLSFFKSLSMFLSWFESTFGRGDAAAGIDNGFRFLQACEFSFPRYVGALEALIHHALPDLRVDYSAYIVALENWFRPPWMKQLDESGIPLPLGERLRPYLSEPNDRADALRQIANLDIQALENFTPMDLLIIRLSAEN